MFRLRLCFEVLEFWELSPVLQIDFLARSPVFVRGVEGVLRANDLAFEIRREFRMVFCQTCANSISNVVTPFCLNRVERVNERTLYAQVSAQEGLAHVYVLDLHRYLVLLTFG